MGYMRSGNNETKMKNYIIGILLLLPGCTTQKTLQERVVKAKSLCCSQKGLWYIQGDMAHCNNGTNFFNLDQLQIIDPSCGNN